jgi:hypothetical protein
MSIRDACRRVIDIIEGCSVSDGPRFRCIDVDSGASLPVEGMPDSDDRLFALDVGAVADDGEAGCLPARVTVECAIRIRYRLAGSALARHIRQADDARRLRDALMLTPALYVSSLTGLQRVDLLPGAREAVTIPGQTTAAHEVLVLPCILEVDP